jgi:hypothetical protein
MKKILISLALIILLLAAVGCFPEKVAKQNTTKTTTTPEANKTVAEQKNTENPDYFMQSQSVKKFVFNNCDLYVNGRARASVKIFYQKHTLGTGEPENTAKSFTGTLFSPVPDYNMPGSCSIDLSSGLRCNDYVFEKNSIAMVLENKVGADITVLSISLSSQDDPNKRCEIRN